MTVLAGTAPACPVPLVLAKLAYEGGTIIVNGLMKEKKRTLAPFCWYG